MVRPIGAADVVRSIPAALPSNAGARCGALAKRRSPRSGKIAGFRRIDRRAEPPPARRSYRRQ